VGKCFRFAGIGVLSTDPPIWVLDMILRTHHRLGAKSANMLALMATRSANTAGTNGDRSPSECRAAAGAIRQNTRALVLFGARPGGPEVRWRRARGRAGSEWSDELLRY